MKWWQILLWPFSLMYGSIMAVRNWLYKIGWLKSTSFDIPTIVVGNLEMGGSGKSPFVDYLATHLQPHYTIGILSRGYGRETKGYKTVNVTSKPNQVGDESLMLKIKHPKALVAVCEKRVEGINNMLSENQQIDCILLDDAFQHSSLSAGLYILLTQFSSPFYNDFVLPAGRLREFALNKKRANIIVVTKSPANLSLAEQKKITDNIKPNRDQSVYFASYKQADFIQVYGSSQQIEKEVILITGIANATQLKKEISQSFNVLKHVELADHFEYKLQSFKFLKEKEWSTKSIITTEKDWVKWQPFLTELEGFNVHVAPIKVEMESEKEMVKEVMDYIEKIKKAW